LFTHLCLGLSSGLLLSGFPIYILYAFLFSPVNELYLCFYSNFLGIGHVNDIINSLRVLFDCILKRALDLNSSPVTGYSNRIIIIFLYPWANAGSVPEIGNHHFPSHF
jgi:hypothetical protein